MSWTRALLVAAKLLMKRYPIRAVSALVFVWEFGWVFVWATEEEEEEVALRHHPFVLSAANTACFAYS